jgi:hypothetical protein
MRTSAIKALAAAASLAVIGWAGQALAEGSPTLTLTSADMDRRWVVNVYDPGQEGAYSNGVLFQVANDGGVTSLYGFCIDVFHNMYLGPLNSPNGYAYQSNQPTGGGLLANSPQAPIVGTQATLISDLVDTGYNLFYGEAAGWYNNSANDEAEERLAAIQAAIWYTEDHSYVHPDQFTGSFATYFNEYIGTPGTANVPGVGYDNTRGVNDKVYTIYNTANQSFAIGWPIDVPEPTTWALMLTGFLGMGTMLRRQRKAAAATA